MLRRITNGLQENHVATQIDDFTANEDQHTSLGLAARHFTVRGGYLNVEVLKIYANFSRSSFVDGSKGRSAAAISGSESFT